MPEIARFDGIAIYMNFGDHAPPHFHVRYAGITWSVTIGSLQVEDGHMPSAIFRRVRDWAEGREGMLLARWTEFGGAQARE